MNLRAIALCVAVIAWPGLGQEVVSVRAGLIHYTEGEIYLENESIDSRGGSKGFSQFPSWRAGTELQTREGRAEVLIAPGIFLRVDKESTLRMLEDGLEDTRMELTRGRALLQAVELAWDVGVSIVCGEATVLFKKKGLYQIDANPFELRVYDGQAEVIAAGRRSLVSRGALVELLDQHSRGKFDPDKRDELHLWSERRAKHLSAANKSAANTARNTEHRARAPKLPWTP